MVARFGAKLVNLGLDRIGSEQSVIDEFGEDNRGVGHGFILQLESLAINRGPLV
jgi:hypothetical protein